MEPAKLDLVWRRNAPAQTFFSLEFENEPIDLTGFTFRMNVRLYPGAAGAAIISLTMASEGQPGFFIDDAANGRFVLTPLDDSDLEDLVPSPEDTDDVTKGLVVLYYDILALSADDNPESICYGKLTVDSGVTRL